MLGEGCLGFHYKPFIQVYEVQLKAGEHLKLPPKKCRFSTSSPRKLRYYHLLIWNEKKKKNNWKLMSQPWNKCIMQLSKYISDHLRQWPEKSYRKHVELVARTWQMFHWGLGNRKKGTRGRNGGVVLLEHLFPMKDETKKQPSDVHGWRRGRYSTSKQVHAEVNRSWPRF